ncbi:hypothetical protein AXF42_Ash000576 [Apostasia shenzhenica]|uniref:Uncharacterized protein n=1 Tax=Apostasia shenzhenica TaxID=1088818 RepID=A0A2I0AGQ7_9ASPA|nr:hypothetical protein AXF42_Ash000576 [Apostasia shenzhenica]
MRGVDDRERAMLAQRCTELEAQWDKKRLSTQRCLQGETDPLNIRLLIVKKMREKVAKLTITKEVVEKERNAVKRSC